MANHAHTTPHKSPPVAVVTSRRIALATALLALSGAAVARAVEPASPDAELLELCNGYVATWTAQRAEWDGADEETRRRLAADATAKMFRERPSDDPEWQAAVAISRMRAQTQEGIQAKARVVQCWLRDCGAELEPRFQADSGVAAAWSLVADVLGGV